VSHDSRGPLKVQPEVQQAAGVGVPLAVVPVAGLCDGDELLAYQRPEEVGFCGEFGHGGRLPVTAASFSLEE
jgi:hypothetical protein